MSYHRGIGALTELQPTSLTKHLQRRRIFLFYIDFNHTGKPA